MIDFLKNGGIADKVINDIKNANSEANLFNLKCNEEEVLKIINYFNSIGLTCVNELLVNRINLFFMDFNTLNDRLSKYDLNKFVQLVNNDYMIIDQI